MVWLSADGDTPELRRGAGATALDRADPRHDQAASAAENLGAVDLVLSGSDVDETSAGAARISIEGDFLPEALLKMIGR